MEVAQKKKKKALDGNSGQVIEILVAQKQGRDIQIHYRIGLSSVLEKMLPLRNLYANPLQQELKK